MRNIFKMLMNNRGELDLGGKDSFTAAEVQDLVSKQLDGLVQPKIDGIVQSRLAQVERKYEGYDDLKKFKIDHEANTAADEQKRLEAQGKYEEAMKVHDTKINDLNSVITSKESTISTMMIGNALTSEIVTQGGYLEESLAMLRASAELKDGVVTIKGKDANGLDQSFSVADGIKSFLEKRPHLVRANANAGGGGSGTAAAAGGGEAGGEDLTSLNNLLAKQTFANDFKGAGETRAKIRTLAAKNGHTLSTGIIA